MDLFTNRHIGPRNHEINPMLEKIGAASMEELIDRTIEVEFWRVPAERIPRDPDAQIDWLYDHWSRVDEWVGSRSEAASMATATSRNTTPLG